MKQTLSFLLVLVLITFSTAEAQIGIRAEGIFSKINGNDVFTKSVSSSGGTTVNFQTGYGAALTFQIPLGANFSFQPEIHYARKGFKLNSTIGDTSLIGKISVDGSLVTQYVDIPLLLKLNFGSREHTHLYIVAGPYLGYALSGTVNASTTVGGQSTTSSNPFDFIANNYNRADYGIIGGVGVGFRLGGGTLTFDARYNQGLGNLNKSTSTTTTTSTGTVNNQWVSVGLGYVFGF